MIDLKDLATKDANSTSPMQLLHPATQEPLGITLHIYSPYADVMQAKEKVMSRSILKSSLKTRSKGKELTGQAIDELLTLSDSNWIDSIAKWEDVEYEGKKLKCDEEGKALFAKIVPFAKEQVLEFYRDLENFF